MPSPPCARSSVRSSCVKGSNTVESAAAGMPIPLSRTRNTTSRPSRATCTSILPPGSVYFAALLIRLPRTCARRAKSPRTPTGSSGRRSVSAWRCASMIGRLVSTAAPTTSAASSASSLRSILPRVIRDRSSRSSTRRVSCLSCRPMTSRAQATCSAAVFRPQHVHGVRDRGERIAKLVRQHREELVLALVRLLDAVIEQRIVERCRSPAGDVAGESTSTSGSNDLAAGHAEHQYARIAPPRTASGTTTVECAGVAVGKHRRRTASDRRDAATAGRNRSPRPDRCAARIEASSGSPSGRLDTPSGSGTGELGEPARLVLDAGHRKHARRRTAAARRGAPAPASWRRRRASRQAQRWRVRGTLSRCVARSAAIAARACSSRKRDALLQRLSLGLACQAGSSSTNTRTLLRRISGTTGDEDVVDRAERVAARASASRRRRR